MTSMDLWLYRGQKVKIVNKHFENRTGVIEKYNWTTRDYLVVMDNGKVLPFYPSEIEMLEDDIDE